MDRIVECVPNFSEGRNPQVIQQIAEALGSVDGATLLDVDPGKATHRTVYTVVGDPDAVVEAAFRGIEVASKLIDMQQHAGEHPRMGACDVCPFVPVRGLSMEDCAALARRLGERVGGELGIPVYLYENAASRPERQNLATVRSGEYEGLEAKLADPEWKPDFGPAAHNPRSGATAIGAREFLVAYNVNLNSRAKRHATEVALEVREQGRNLRGADGKFVRDENGVPIKRPGRLKECKAVGWYIDEYQRAQISMNLTNITVTGIHEAFDACDEEARKIGCRVTGSEVVGLVPLEALLESGRHYLRRSGRSSGLPESQILETAIQSMGLAELTPFDPAERIIEYRLEELDGTLRTMKLTDFVDETSSESPAPGGGSVAALCGSLGAALCAMVGNLTVGKKKLEASFEAADRCSAEAQRIKDWFLRAIDADTEAFDQVMAAIRMKQGSDEEKAARDKALREANRGATLVPLSVLEKTHGVVDLAHELLERGNPNARSDAATAAACALACAEGAYFNVLTNLDGLEGDDAWCRDIRAKATSLVETTRERATSVQARFVGMMG